MQAADITSLMMPQADASKNAGRKPYSEESGGAKFGDIFSGKQSEMNAGRKSDYKAAERPETRKEMKKPEELKSTDMPEESEELESKENGKPDAETEALAMSLIGNQNVVFILEGDKESATNPELQIDGIDGTAATVITTADTVPVQTVSAEQDMPELEMIDGTTPETGPGIKPETEPGIELGTEPGTEPETRISEEVKAEFDTESKLPAEPKLPADTAPKLVEESEVKTEAKSEAKTEAKSETEAAPVIEQISVEAEQPKADTVDETVTAVNSEINADTIRKSVNNTDNTAPKVDNEQENAIGEVTARMPVIGTTENFNTENSGEENADFTENGDLSPLENENDTPHVATETKSKTFTETIKDAQETKDSDTQHTAEAPAAPMPADIRPEQFQSRQELSQIQQDAPVKPENLFDTMVDRIEMMQSAEQNEMSIQLKPEFLGKVTLNIAMDANGLKVKINAADQEIRGMIGGQIDSLIESLSNKGIEVVKVEVAYTGVDNGSFTDPQENQQQDNGRSRRTASKKTAGEAYFAPQALEALEHYMDIGVSSVEYRA